MAGPAAGDGITTRVYTRAIGNGGGAACATHTTVSM